MRVNRYALLALLLSVFAWAALLSPFYFTGTHDGRHSLFYQLQFSQGVADGHWFPRWGPDFGFGRGYPFFIFYAPLTSYIVHAVYSWPTAGLVASVKVTWLLGFLVGAAGAFRLARAWWRDDRAAFIASLIYTYVPYKLVDIYVRGALAEFWSLALLPWVVLTFYCAIHAPHRTTLARAALLYAALILTHVGTAFLFSALLGALILFEIAVGEWQRRIRSQRDQAHVNANGLTYANRTMATQPGISDSVFAIGGGLLLGILNATIFWLPLLTEQRYIDVTQYLPANYNFANQFTEWAQFFSPAWGFGYAVPGPTDDMSFQLGVAPVLLVLAGGWVLAGRRLPPLPSARLIMALVSLLIVLVAMTDFTYPLWQGFPLAGMVQFPWRALGITALLLSLAGGGVSRALLPRVASRRAFHPALALMACLVLLGSQGYTTPLFTPPSEREETLLTILDFQREYPDMAGRLSESDIVPQTSPMEAQYEALQPLQKFRLLTGVATITQSYYGGSTVTATISVTQPATLEVMTYNYPGWTLYRNGVTLPHRTQPPEGTIAFDLPVGTHTITARFENTPTRLVAGIISVATLAVTLLFIVSRPGREQDTP